MPETKPSPEVELAEFAAAIVIATLVALGAYLVSDLLPFPVTLIGAVLVAFVATAMVSLALSRWEARRCTASRS